MISSSSSRGAPTSSWRIGCGSACCSLRLRSAPFVLGLCLTVVVTGSGLALRSMAEQSLASPDQARYNVRNDLPRVYRDGCHQPFRKDDSPECVYGDKHGARTMVLFGDSHAAQWFPALERIAQEKKWRLISLTKSACPSVWATPSHPGLGPECGVYALAFISGAANHRRACRLGGCVKLFEVCEWSGD